jgi:hypothetical protein
MTTYRVALSFAQLSDAKLDDFTQNIIASLTGNASFPTPTVPPADLSSALSTFTATLAATAQGGTQATAAKNAARDALMALLRKEANYVQGIASTDLAMLLSSGFEAINSNRSQSPLDKPSIMQINNEASTQLVLRLQPVDNARSYEVRVSYGANGWQAAGVFTQARRVVLTNLTPGTNYNIQARAVGGSTGYSDWSDPVSHMAT